MAPIWLFAQVDRLEAMRRAFDGSRGYFSDSDVSLVVALASVLAGVLVLFLLARLIRKSSWIRDNRYLLFVELCWAHGLGIGDSLLLLQLARRHQMENPAFIFLEPDVFAQAALSETQGARFEGLYHRLF